MINIQREPTIPVSLQRPEIQTYLDKLDKLEDFKAGKTKTEPIKPDWRKYDLLDAFDRCFHGKCYLTEQKFANSWKMDVEHFVTKSEEPSKTYDWHNLFPCDHDANMQKPKKTPIGGYLNPCIDNPEEKLYQCLLGNGASRFEAKDINDPKAVNTASLLNDIHNGKATDKGSIKKADNIKGLIDTKQQLVWQLIMKWQSYKIKGDKIGEIQAETNLRSELSRKSEFTMLIRSMAAVREFVPVDFLD